MHIDPYAWLFTLPATAALIQLYFQPADFVIKRWWNVMLDWESRTAERLSLLGWSLGGGDRARRTRIMYGITVTSLGLCSLASFGAFAGVIG